MISFLTSLRSQSREEMVLIILLLLFLDSSLSSSVKNIRTEATVLKKMTSNENSKKILEGQHEEILYCYSQSPKKENHVVEMEDTATTLVKTEDEEEKETVPVIVYLFKAITQTFWSNLRQAHQQIGSWLFGDFSGVESQRILGDGRKEATVKTSKLKPKKYLVKNKGK